MKLKDEIEKLDKLHAKHGAEMDAALEPIQEKLNKLNKKVAKFLKMPEENVSVWVGDGGSLVGVTLNMPVVKKYFSCHYMRDTGEPFWAGFNGAAETFKNPELDEFMLNILNGEGGE